MADFFFSSFRDTMLSEASADITFATDPTLFSSNSTGQQTQSLVQFDIFGDEVGQISSGTTITSATLTFDVTDETADTVSLHRMLAGWDETATWNTLIDGVIADDTEAVSIADATVSGAALGTLALDVTTSVQAWSDGTTNNGWVLFGGTDLFGVQSGENTIVPILSVTTEDAPPTSGALRFENGNDGYFGVTDTYIRENRATTDYSSNTKIYVEGSEPGGGEMQALLEFDDIFGNQPGQIPLGAIISSATLEFDIGDKTNDPISIYEMRQTWSQNADLTWDAFGNGIQTDGVEADSSAIVSLPSGISTGTQIIDVTESLQNWSDGTDNHGWLLTSNGENLWRFASSESGSGPVLNVIFDNSGTPQPESGTLSFEQAVDGYLKTDDTYLREARATTDYSTNTKIYIEGMETGGGEMQALLSFGNLFGSGLNQVPVGSSITSAVLELEIGDRTQDEINLHEMLIDWTSFSQKTWDAFGSGIQTDDIEAASDASLTLPTGIGNQTQTFDVTSSVQSWADGDDNYGWLLTSTGQDLWRFASAESDNAPVLRITYDNSNTPQPPTATLTFAQGTDGYLNTTDTYLREARSDKDYSSNNKVYIEGLEPSGGEMQALLSFGNLFGSGLNQIPLGATITEATLQLDIGDGTDDPISFYDMLIDWTAFSDKSWDAFDSGIQTNDIEAASNSSISLIGGLSSGIREIDVTTSLQSWSDGATNNGWLIKSDGDNLWRFASSESDSVPALIVSYTTEDIPPPPPGTFDPSLVAVHDTLLYNADDPSGFGSGDPSGIAYVPGLDRLFMVDSEHDESPYFSPVNLFVVEPGGTYDTAYSLSAFTNEPTGIGYNAANGLLYITDDDQEAVFVVDPTDPSTLLQMIDLAGYGIDDAEEPVFDPATGNMFIVDGQELELYEIAPDGTLISIKSFADPIQDVEGFALDAENDVFFAASGTERGTIYQLDRDLNIIDSNNFLDSFLNPVTGKRPKIKGLEFAPSSDPNDGDDMSLYVANYGNDQIADGQLFEIDPYDDFVFV